MEVRQNIVLQPHKPGTAIEQVIVNGVKVDVRVTTGRYTIEANAHDFSINGVRISSAMAQAVEHDAVINLLKSTIGKAVETRKLFETSFSWAIVTLD